MTVKLVTYKETGLLSCASCLPAEIIICLSVEGVVVPPNCSDESAQPYAYTYLNASLISVDYVSAGCGSPRSYYLYTIQYDTDTITLEEIDPTTIEGILCKNTCLVTFIQQYAGDEVAVRDNEDGSFTLLSQHGCEFDFITGGELSSLIVADTNSVALTLTGAVIKTLTADIVIDPDPSNQISVSASGVYVTSGWGLLGNSGTVFGTNFLGTTDDIGLDIRVRNQSAIRIDPTALTTGPNIIGGYYQNSIATSVVGSSVLGGGYSGQINSISNGTYNAIVGGYGNLIASTGNGNTIINGQGNFITIGSNSGIGGRNCKIEAIGCFIGGGLANAIGENPATPEKSDYSAISGGEANFIGESNYCFVGGGQENNIFTSSYRSAIVGGISNVIAQSPNSFIGGGNNNSVLNVVTTNNGSCVLSGNTNTIDASISSCIAGGANNTIDNPGATTANRNFIGAGQVNTIRDTRESFIGAGANNTVSGRHSFIGAGDTNVISTGGDYASILAGRDNQINGDDSSILGGSKLRIQREQLGFLAGDYAVGVVSVDLTNVAFRGTAHFLETIVAVGSTQPVVDSATLVNNRARVRFYGVPALLDSNFGSRRYVELTAPLNSVLGASNKVIGLPGNTPTVNQILKVSAVTVVGSLTYIDTVWATDAT